jgi:hypothetical protein
MGGSSEHDRGCSVWVQPFPRSQTFLSLDTFDRPVRLDVPKSDLNEVLSLSELEMNAQGKKIEESDLIAAHLKKGKGRGGGGGGRIRRAERTLSMNLKSFRARKGALFQPTAHARNAS